MDADDVEWVKRTIIEAERKRCISKILKVDTNKAVPDGNNYVSDIFRLTLKIVNNGGELEERSVIYKVFPLSYEFKLPKDTILEEGLFVTEIRMYTDVFPEMENIVRKTDPQFEPFWAQIYGARKLYQGYLVEDLSVKGYRMIDRMKGMDFDHCTLTVKTLAMFHGLSAILIERGTVHLSDFNGKYFFINEDESCKKLYEDCLSNIVAMLGDKWKGEWIEYADKVREFKENLHQRLVELYKFDEKRFNVLNHGDFWTNNVMFRMDKTGRPQHARVVDYQMIHYNSPCFDLHYLFSTSLQPQFFKKRRELLRSYYHSLEETLKRFGYKREVLSFDELVSDFDRTEPFGLTIALSMRVFMTSPSKKELMEMYPDIDKDDRLIFFAYDGEYLVNSLKTILKGANDSRLI